MKLKFQLIIVLLVSWQIHAAIRIATYNINSGIVRAELKTVLEAMGDDVIDGISGPVDLLFLQEQNPDDSVETTQSIADLMNQINNTDAYLTGTVYPNGISSGGSPGVIYNRHVVELLEEVGISTAGPRSPVRYKFKIIGYASNDAIFYVYCCHFKAGSSDTAMRASEAMSVRQNADGLGDGKNIIYLGDFNLYTSSETAWRNLTTGIEAGKAVDPVNTAGNWHDNSLFKLWHTQSPLVTSTGSLVGGGVDDRFDFQLISDEINDTDGFAFIPETYRSFGNNGTHITNSSISTGSGASSAVLAALMKASDHLPVIAEYQIPAVMSVAIETVSSPSVICPGYQVKLNVSNTADVESPVEADELNYIISLEADATGEWGPLPSGWNAVEIGTISQDAESTYNSENSAFTIQGTGNVSGTSDNFYYVYQPFSGDGEFYYRLDSLTTDNLNAIAGLMLREDLSPNCPFAYLHLSGSEEAAFRRRYYTNGLSMATPYVASALPKWLKITRAGSLITTYTSEDGLTWDAFQSDTIEMESDIYVGFAIATFDASLTTSHFSLSSSGGSIANGTIYADLAGQIATEHDVELPTETEGDQVIKLVVCGISQAVENPEYAEVISFRVTHQPDFDNDLDFDIDDIDLFLSHLGSSMALYDLDRNGTVDLADLDYLIHNIMGEYYGDANLNRIVNIQDLAVFMNNYLQPLFGWEKGDFNGDGFVDLEDFAMLSQDWMR